MKKNLLIMALLAVSVAACDNRPQYAMQPQQYAQPAPVAAQAPVIVQSGPQHSGGDMLTGALLGAAAGHLLTKNSQPAAAPAPVHTVTRVVERRTVVNNYISRPTPRVAAPAPARVTPSYSAARSVSAPSYSMARSYGGKR